MDNTKDEKAFRQDLLNIAKTTLSSKVLSQDKEMFAEIAVNAVLKLKGASGTPTARRRRRRGRRRRRRAPTPRRSTST